MHIVIVNGNSTHAHTRTIEQAASRCAAPSTTIAVVEPHNAPASIETFASIHVSALAILQAIADVVRQADAVVIACFSDPGLYAAREVAAVPVIGAAEAAMHMACVVARRFSILAGADDRHALVQEVVNLHGFGDRCASIRTIGLPVLATDIDRGDTQARLIEAGRAAVHEERAEAILLGCAAYSGMEGPLGEALGVPVLDGVVCAVKLAEAVVGAGLHTSRVGAFKRVDLAHLALVL